MSRADRGRGAGLELEPPVASRRAALARELPLLARAGLVCAWATGLLAAVRGVQLAIAGDNLGSDAHAYWLAGRSTVLPYDLAPGQRDAFLYSPAFAQVVSPLAQLPWQLFLAVWIALELAALVWLLAPLTTRWAVPLGMLCVPELVNGNVYLLLAAVAVVGLRHPAAWALPTLTKVLPGAGALWFVFRGEWRKVAVAGLVTLAVVATSYALAPDDWQRWLAFLVDHRHGTRDSGLVFVTRCLVALGLLGYGARAGRPWVLAPVMALLCPALAPTTATLLVAVPRLLEVPAGPAGAGGPKRT